MRKLVYTLTYAKRHLILKIFGLIHQFKLILKHQRQWNVQCSVQILDPHQSRYILVFSKISDLFALGSNDR